MDTRLRRASPLAQAWLDAPKRKHDTPTTREGVQCLNLNSAPSVKQKSRPRAALTWEASGTAKPAGISVQLLTTSNKIVPRPKPPEVLKSRYVRMSDSEWQAFKELGGAEWLRKMMNTRPRRYYEVFEYGPSKKELND